MHRTEKQEKKNFCGFRLHTSMFTIWFLTKWSWWINNTVMLDVQVAFGTKELCKHRALELWSQRRCVCLWVSCPSAWSLHQHQDGCEGKRDATVRVGRGAPDSCWSIYGAVTVECKHLQQMCFYSVVHDDLLSNNDTFITKHRVGPVRLGATTRKCGGGTAVGTNKNSKTHFAVTFVV